MHFKLMLRSRPLAMGQRIHLFLHLFLTTFLEYLFDSIIPEIVLIDKLHDFDEGICIPNNGCLFFIYHSNDCYKEKIFIKI